MKVNFTPSWRKKTTLRKKTTSLELQPTEYQQQVAFVGWLRLKYPRLTIFHVANGEYRTKFTASKLRRMGVLPGVFDLYLMDYHLFIEFKRSKSQKLTPAQSHFEENAKSTGHSTLVVHGLDDAIYKMENFMDCNDTK